VEAGLNCNETTGSRARLTSGLLQHVSAWRDRATITITYKPSDVYDTCLRVTTEPAQTLACTCSLILSRIDYCNSVLHAVPTSGIQKLQRVQNHATSGAKAITHQVTTPPAALAAGPTADHVQVGCSHHFDADVYESPHQTQQCSDSTHARQRVHSCSSRFSVQPSPGVLSAFSDPHTWNSLPKTVMDTEQRLVAKRHSNL